ncbi:MAG: hypothetical protein E3J72_07425 [Planctomycetota bacterium]|nr:MAG: hypothetical protein E3J72_07425 [Planctomycetota bacterium]
MDMEDREFPETATQSRPGVFMAAIICIMVVIIATGGIAGAWLLYNVKVKELKTEYEEMVAGLKTEVRKYKYKMIWLKLEKEEIEKEAAEARTQYIFENQRLKQLIEEEKRKASK